MRLVGTVALVGHPELRADARRGAGIDQRDRDSRETRLVLDKGAKLMERPTVLAATLCLLNRCPVADARQISQGNAAFGVVGFRDHLLGSPVVHVGGETRFFLNP
jgi:hypothetical protein